MKTRRISIAALALGAAAVLLPGCAWWPERGAFTGGTIGAHDYETADIAVLPVAVNPQYGANPLPAASLQRAVASAFEHTFGRRPAIVAETAASAPAMFPLTPARLAELARQSGRDGLVGVSVPAWSRESAHPGAEADGDARVDLLIAYGDARDPARHWTLTGTWSAGSVRDLPTQVSAGLPRIMEDLRRALAPSPLASIWTRRQPPGPSLTFIGPMPLLTHGNETEGQFLDLLVTAVDEGGIRTLHVENGASRFEWTLAAEPDDAGGYPVFLSSKLRVPLDQGRNRVALSATSASASAPEARRGFEISSSARHGLAFVSVGFDPASAEAGLAQAGRRLAQAARQAGATALPASLGAIPLSASTRDVLRKSAERTGVGDTTIIYVYGRVWFNGSALYVGAPAGEKARDGGRSARIDDIVHVGDASERLLVLELCSDVPGLALARDSLRATLAGEPWALAELTPCAQPVTPLADAVVAALGERELPGRARDYYEATLRKAAALQTTGIISGRDWPGTSAATVSAQASPAQAAAARATADHQLREPARFYVVAYSFQSREEAQRQAERLRAEIPDAGVILGTSGQYGVTVASAPDVGQAFEALRQARASGRVNADAYVIPPARVLLVVDPSP